MRDARYVIGGTMEEAWVTESWRDRIMIRPKEQANLGQAN